VIAVRHRDCLMSIGVAVALGVCGLLAGCSSSEDDGIGNLSNALAARCAADNPYVSAALADPPLSRRDERAWVGAFIGEAYLWYAEIPTLDADAPRWDEGPYLDSMRDWFLAQRTPALTAAGRRKDRYSFLYPAEEYRRIADAGVIHGYGLEWRIGSTTPPRDIRVAYVNPATPASAAGIERGDRLEAVTIDGVTDVVDTADTAGIARLNRALYPARGGPPNTLRLRSAAGVVRDVVIAGVDATTQPVLLTAIRDAAVHDRGTGRVGYLVVNDFVAPAEGQLVTAFARFRSEGVTELIVDLRYNGGGYLYLASQLAAMIAGPARVAEPVFERFRYNDKRMAVIEPSQTDIRFRMTTTGFSGSGTAAGAALPALDLRRVVILTTADTCSASESVINGLQGVDFPVIRIGSTTCGKPYGFSARDNCGVSYFPIEFQGVNAKGFGDYDDGFSADCDAGDDLGRPLGDPAEGLLANALGYLATGACPTSAGAGASAASSPSRGKSQRPDAGFLRRGAIRESRYLHVPSAD
jgi:carboxyl-terminal processing protease